MRRQPADDDAVRTPDSGLAHPPLPSPYSSPPAEKTTIPIPQSNYQSVRSRKFAISLICEFVGTMLFSFIGSTVASPVLGPL